MPGNASGSGGDEGGGGFLTFLVGSLSISLCSASIPPGLSLLFGYTFGTPCHLSDGLRTMNVLKCMRF